MRALDERKDEVRLRARDRRRAMGEDVRSAKDALIRKALLALPELDGVALVGAYVGVHSEVDTRGVIRELLARGARVAVPVVTPPERMRLAEVGSLDELAPGAHGIPEPLPPRVFLDDADALLVPGLLFAKDGHRLGQGGGYFDRLLQATPHATRIGLAYDEQLVDKLPIEAHDEPMDLVVTDARVMRCPPRPSRTDRA